MSKKSPFDLERLATALLLSVQKEVQRQMPMDMLLTTEQISKLKEAESLINDAIDLFSDFDEEKYELGARINRSAIRILLIDKERALEDIEYVILKDKYNSVALSNKARFLLDDGLNEEAMKCLLRIKEENRTDEYSLLISFAFIELGKYDKSIELLRPLWDKAYDVNVADILMQSYIYSKKIKEYLKIEKEIELKYGERPEALLVLARNRGRNGDIEVATEIYGKALIMSDDDQKRSIYFEFGDLYYTNGMFKEASNEYKNAVNVNVINNYLKKYLISLMNSKAYKEALTIAKKLRSDGPPIPVISEIEAKIYFYLDNLEDARELFVKLSVIEEGKYEHIMSVLNIDLRLSDMDALEETLQKINYEDIKDDANALILVSQAKALLRDKEAFKFGYKALKVDPLNINVQQIYFGLIFSPWNIADLMDTPQTVDTDTAVVLVQKDSNIKRSFVIIDDKEKITRNDEINTSNELAKRLIGKKKGDVILVDGYVKNDAYVIEEVKSKYLHAAHMIIAESSTIFPESRFVQSVDVKEGDTSEIFKMIDKRREFVDGIMKVRKEKRIPLGVVANSIGVSKIELMSNLIANPDEEVFVSLGTAKDLEVESFIANSAKDVVLDLSAIVTFLYIDKIDLLIERFERILISRRLMDNLNALEMNLSDSRKKSMSIAKEGGKYIRYDVTEDDIKSKKDYIIRIRKFIEMQTEIMDSSYMLEEDEEAINKIEEFIGHDSMGSIFVAKENKALFLCDDFGTRIFAKDTFNIESVWTQSILSDALKKGLIEKAEYSNAVSKLLEARYLYTSINAENIFDIFLKEKNAKSQEMARFFKMLHAPGTTDETAVVVAVILIQISWLELIDDKEKENIIFAALDAVSEQRDLESILYKLRNGLLVKFKLFRQPLTPILRLIRKWLRSKEYYEKGKII